MFTTNSERTVKFKKLLEKLPGVKIVFSCPTVRYDNQKARLTILQLRNNLQQLRNNLQQLDVSVISNDNLIDEHLRYKGLHLNNRGSSRLAWNYLAHIRKH